jgi:hypothetical protein
MGSAASAEPVAATSAREVRKVREVISYPPF